MKKALLFSIFIYQKTLSFFLGGRCRFYPSCSEYFKETLDKYRIDKAIVLSLQRLAKCHPWHPGGVDFP